MGSTPSRRGAIRGDRFRRRQVRGPGRRVASPLRISRNTARVVRTQRVLLVRGQRRAKVPLTATALVGIVAARFGPPLPPCGGSRPMRLRLLCLLSAALVLPCVALPAAAQAVPLSAPATR